MPPLFDNKNPKAKSVFVASALLREARRQKDLATVTRHRNKEFFQKNREFCRKNRKFRDPDTIIGKDGHRYARQPGKEITFAWHSHRPVIVRDQVTAADAR